MSCRLIVPVRRRRSASSRSTQWERTPRSRAIDSTAAWPAGVTSPSMHAATTSASTSARRARAGTKGTPRSGRRPSPRRVRPDQAPWRARRAGLRCARRAAAAGRDHGPRRRDRRASLRGRENQRSARAPSCTDEPPVGVFGCQGPSPPPILQLDVAMSARARGREERHAKTPEQATPGRRTAPRSANPRGGPRGHARRARHPRDAAGLSVDRIARAAEVDKNDVCPPLANPGVAGGRGAPARARRREPGARGHGHAPRRSAHRRQDRGARARTARRAGARTGRVHGIEARPRGARAARDPPTAEPSRGSGARDGDARAGAGRVAARGVPRDAAGGARRRHPAPRHARAPCHDEGVARVARGAARGGGRAAELGD